MKSLPTCTFLNNIGDCPSSIDSPLQIKLINLLGLKNYMIDNFIFSRKPTKYLIRKYQNRQILITSDQLEYVPHSNYRIQVKIIQTSSNSIPIIRLTPRHKKNNILIIYAHGNASDMSDSLAFVQRLSEHIQCQFIIFDYTGYGESRISDVGQQVICRDLEIVLAWAKDFHRLENIVLWGFSLGTFPVVVNAAKYQHIGAVILQCPIASICCLFHSDLHQEMRFKEDHFANINYIDQIKSKVLIMHSNSDEIIPFEHGKLLYQKYVSKNGQNNIDFIQIGGGAKHNSLHKFIVSSNQNVLQKEVLSFLDNFMYEKATRTSTNISNSTQTSKLFKLMMSSKHLNQIKSTNSFSNNSQLMNSHNMSHSNSLRLRFTEECQKQLKQLRIRITEADTQPLNEDMQEIVVDLDQQRKEKNRQSYTHQKQSRSVNKTQSTIHKSAQDKIRDKLLNQKLMKNCFCFQGNL